MSDHPKTNSSSLHQQKQIENFQLANSQENENLSHFDPDSKISQSNDQFIDSFEEQRDQIILRKMSDTERLKIGKDIPNQNLSISSNLNSHPQNENNKAQIESVQLHLHNGGAYNEFVLNSSIEKCDIKLNQTDSFPLSENVLSNTLFHIQKQGQFTDKKYQTGYSFDTQQEIGEKKKLAQTNNNINDEQKENKVQSEFRSLSNSHQNNKSKSQSFKSRSGSSRKDDSRQMSYSSRRKQQEQKKNSSNESYQLFEENSFSSAFKLTSLGKYEELNKFCKENSILYTEIQNEQGNSLLIKAIQNKDIEGIKQLLRESREQLRNKGLKEDQIEEKIIEWINSESKSGYTAAHFGCYIGDAQILLLLKKEGADFLKQNMEGSSGLHVAAQNDSIAAIIFLLLLGIDINCKDYKDATPLHWASFQGLDQSVQYLLSFGAFINEQDSEGMTPLILSTISGSVRIVRMLLFAGANKFMKDNKGRNALFMVEEDPDNINEDIAEMLKRTNGFQEYWNIRPVFKPQNKNVKQICYYLIMYSIAHIGYYFFTWNLLDEQKRFIIGIILIFLGIFTNFSFFFAWLREPGYVNYSKEALMSHSSISQTQQVLEEIIEQQEKNIKLQSQNMYSSDFKIFSLDENKKKKLIKLFILLSSEQDSSKVCSHCCILKPKRSRHCEICKECVSVYDHHCPWINNCVGTRNHLYFLIFIISIWCTLVALSVLNAIFCWKSNYNSQYLDPFHLFTENHETLFMIFKITFAGLTIFFSLLFGIPLTLLLFVQISNFTQNKTTFERFSQAARNFRHQSSQKGAESLLNSEITPEVNNSSNLSLALLNEQEEKDEKIQNCLKMCCQNQKTSNLIFREQN